MYGSARSVGRGEAKNGGGRDGGGNQGSGRSPRLPRSPRMGHRRTNSTGGSGGGPGGAGGKTLSMENIQSLNAAYATSGPMYLSDNEVAMAGEHVPKSGVTITATGRQRVTYVSRGSSVGVVAASTPNISTTVPANAVLPAGMMAGDALAFGDHHMASTVPHSLRQARDNTILDLQAQLKEVLYWVLLPVCRIGNRDLNELITDDVIIARLSLCSVRCCVRTRCCGERWK